MRLTTPVIVSILLFPGCSSGGSPHRSGCDNPRGTLTTGPQALATAAPGTRWNVSVIVNNVAQEQRRVRVSLDGRRGVDVTLPPGCGGIASPMHESRFRLKASTMRLRAVSSSGAGREKTVLVNAAKRIWILVTDNQPLRLGVEINVYHRPPRFG